MPTELWPPLSVIRNALETGSAVPEDGADEEPGLAVMAMPGATPGTRAEPVRMPAMSSLLLPLAELARRREAVALRAFPARWAPAGS